MELCRRAEAAGVSFISVHGRTISQRRDPVDRQAIRTVADAVRVPVIANGDIRSLQDALDTAEMTGVQGRLPVDALGTRMDGHLRNIFFPEEWRVVFCR